MADLALDPVPDRRRPDAEWREALTPFQFRVLRHKATEPRGSGEYDDFYEEGVYVCRACELPLYTSAMKFNCGCGWPGFWDSVPGHVAEEPDEDGFRVEILCAACDGHLGHVFRGESFGNPKDERHCVNSASVRFVAAL